MKIFMEAVRTIVSADVLTPIIDLPWATQDLQVEVIVIPQTKKKIQQQEISVESLAGCLRDYANPTLLEKEQYAWEHNIIEKYGNP